MNKSFTLIEILVVIVIVGILSAFIIVSMSGVSSRANIAKSQAFANSLRNSLLMNLVSEWKLNGNADDAWGSNNGTLVGPTHLPVVKSGSDCVSGGCYQFDGTEDRIDFGNDSSLNFVDAITIEAWIYPITWSGSYPRIIVKETGTGVNSYALYVNPSSILTFVAGGSLSSVSTIPLNRWTHIVGTYNRNGGANNKKLYIDGALNNKVTVTDAIVVTTYNVTMGNNSDNSRQFNGKIDEVRVYNESISAAGIRQSYYSGLNRLLAHNGFDAMEYSQMLGELKTNSADNE